MCMSVVICLIEMCDIRSPNLNIMFLSNGELKIKNKARLQPVTLWKCIISIPKGQKLASDTEHSSILNYIGFVFVCKC